MTSPTNRQGELENAEQALLADSLGTVFGAVMGTSTVTSFVESTSGVAVGGRTGLTACTTGILLQYRHCMDHSPSGTGFAQHKKGGRSRLHSAECSRLRMRNMTCLLPARPRQQTPAVLICQKHRKLPVQQKNAAA